MIKTLSVFFALACSIVLADEPTKSLPRSSPEAQGVSSKSILEFVRAADQELSSLHSVMLVRHGKVVAEGWWSPYNPETRHELYSLSKSFTSTAIGLAIAEGKLTLDDEVSKFFPEVMPADASSQLKAMRVRDLLSMSTGHTSEAKFGTTEPWTKTFLANTVTHKPGTFFMYNTPATYMLSAIVQKQTSTTTLDYLKPRLFDPLGIKDPTWGTSPQGISLGGYGLNLRTEDIAKFGQLYLQRGRWNDRQLVPEAWIDVATSKQVSNGSNPKSDWEQGYGFQFWRCRNGSYRGDGAFGQYCLVMPEKDAVLAITSGLKDMQAVLNLVWDKLLPGINEQTLAPDDDAEQRLKDSLAKLSLPFPEGVADSALAGSIDKQRYEFADNEQKIRGISLEKNSDGSFTLITASEGSEHRIVCGYKAWIKGTAQLGGFAAQEVAASGAWTSESEYTLKLCLYATPFCLTTRLQFKGDEVLLDTEANVGFGTTKRPQIVGRLK